MDCVRGGGFWLYWACALVVSVGERFRMDPLKSNIFSRRGVEHGQEGWGVCSCAVFNVYCQPTAVRDWLLRCFEFLGSVLPSRELLIVLIGKPERNVKRVHRPIRPVLTIAEWAHFAQEMPVARSCCCLEL